MGKGEREKERREEGWRSRRINNKYILKKMQRGKRIP
jgi:hypothetical protein